ncbi:MAG: NAD-dependent epimerase/dehydratase family protein [Caulobacteraceae bacterium]|nr:NAD-dependent epimerase/dehydratase family protein [Caulobacter sp.]
MTVVVTGAAGFIGASAAHRLLDRGEAVVGLDTLDAYYDPALKRERLEALEARGGFRFVQLDIADAPALAELVAQARPTLLAHFAAQAGVRYSLENPFAYERANVAGHLSVLEACRRAAVPQLVYASSSSVYGERPIDGPFRETDPIAAPASLYAATKRSGELMSESYARLYGLAQTGLRFFTVYGPQGRPDMAYWSFTRRILAGEPIEVFGEGRMARDFTYVDDILDGVMGVVDRPAAPGEHRLFNIGAGRPVGLLRMIEVLEQALGREAVKVMRPMQPGDVGATWADVSRLHALCGYAAKTPLEEGLPRFVKWWRGRHG